MDNGKSSSLLTLDNGNDPPTRIPYLENSDENMISTNGGLIRTLF